LNQSSSANTAINTIRCLAIDMVEAAGSGHPGAPMGQAALAYTLWTRFLRFNPDAPDWPNRDRFVLSCGHASALIYALLHLAGYDLDLDELRSFRQLHSKTPGHPEHGLTPGVETTTGPLGQGIGNAVGMALAERLLSDRFNRDDFCLFNHQIWALASDGDMMEGVSSEACSFAGHLRLGKLNVIYDANEITIDGPISLSFSENVSQRFQAYGWHTQTVDDGNDLDALETAFERARAAQDRPSLILVRTHIGFGSPNKQDTAAAHGAALGPEEAAATKEALGWPTEPKFLVPDEAREDFGRAAERGRAEYNAWHRLLERYSEAHPEAAAELARRRRGELAAGWQEALPSIGDEDGPTATRSTSGKVLNSIAELLPELIGGSADLTGSNNTFIDGEAIVAPGNKRGRNLHFGVREHGMGTILNGLALSGLIRPYGGTFLVFSDYMRASVRLAALMRLPAVYVFTHDSVFVGENGPTHQPESHLASLRAIPGLTVIRPADARETVEAWRCALRRTHGPTALILTRQKLPIPSATADRTAGGVARGGYVLRESAGECQVVLVATGSEVSLILSAQSELAEEGISTRVVSLPSWELFEEQPQQYRNEVLPPGSRRLIVEASSSLGWDRYAGPQGEILSIDRFGESAPAADIARALGLTTADVVARVKTLASRSEPA